MPPKKILIVDNDPVILALLNKFLTREGHEVRTVQDGAGALNILNTWVPDILFVDMVMPGISGDRLCRLIREEHPAAHSYICIITAISDGEMLDFLSFGANACIKKEPFNELSKNILALLRDEPLRDRPEIMGFSEQPGQSIIRELIGVKDHLESLISSMGEGVIELDTGRQIAYANDSALHILGRSERELVGRDLAGFFRPDDREAISQALRAAREFGSREKIPRLVLENGREVSLTALSVQNSKGPIVILDDITDQKRAEESMLRAASELEKRVDERTDELRRAKRDLEEELKSKQAAEKKLRDYTTLLMTVLNGISDPVLMAGSNMTVQLANRATLEYCTASGIKDIIGIACEDLFKNRYDETSVKDILKTCRDMESGTFDLENLSDSVKYERIVVDPIRSRGRRGRYHSHCRRHEAETHGAGPRAAGKACLPGASGFRDCP
jgi:PAS domain S-box-containing protein